MDSKNMYSQTCVAIYTKLSICTCKYALIRYGQSEQNILKLKFCIIYLKTLGCNHNGKSPPTKVYVDARPVGLEQCLC